MSISFLNWALPDIIELRNIGVSYNNGQKVVLQDFNLLIEDHPGVGEFIVILGASGCGKSTALRLLAGLQQATQGDVLINGQPLTNQTHISMVFQQYSSLPWLTVLQNVMMPLEFQGVNRAEAMDRARQMLDTVGLLDHEHKYAKYPLLSGGQLQRVAIARSLIANPRIILMDEPFGALDTRTRFQMQMMLAKLWTSLQCTVIFVTHDISEAVFLGDEVYLMSANPGQIVKSWHVDLPLVRDRATKRLPQFLDLVGEIEDNIASMGA